jgi:hypothetical protein
MSEAYHRSVELYWMAKSTDESNREFNVEMKRLAVHDDYHACLRILATYSRTHEDSVTAYSIWGGRKRLGLKFQGRNVTIGVMKGDDIPVGVTSEIRNPFELKRYLENTMLFSLVNLNETIFEKAYEQLKKIEAEKKIRIDRDETKKWSYGPR